jgi:hypothetical protein
MSKNLYIYSYPQIEIHVYTYTHQVLDEYRVSIGFDN